MCEFERNYEVDISFFGKIQVIHQSKAEIIFEKDEIVSIDDFYYPISSDILNKLNTYENEIKEAEKAVVEGDYIRKTYTAKFKGINYVWQIEYRDGVYNGYYFKIYI